MTVLDARVFGHIFFLFCHQLYWDVNDFIVRRHLLQIKTPARRQGETEWLRLFVLVFLAAIADIDVTNCYFDTATNNDCPK